MKVGLIDVDGHNFPNLALMKISAYHKAKGDTVEWLFPFDHYDVVYQSKVFDSTYSPDIDWTPWADKVIKGGTGYGLDNKLPDEVEHMYPDYSLYPDLTKDTAYGFLTRGGCWFCHNQGVDQLRILRRDYPEYWALLLKWDNDSPTTFKPDGHTVHDYEERFKLEDQGLIRADDRWYWWYIKDRGIQLRMDF